MGLWVVIFSNYMIFSCSGKLRTFPLLTVDDHLGGSELVVINGGDAARVPPGEVGANVAEVQRAMLLVGVIRSKKVDIHVILPVACHLKISTALRVAS